VSNFGIATNLPILTFFTWPFCISVVLAMHSRERFVLGVKGVYGKEIRVFL
jgi:hypothetical protein